MEGGRSEIWKDEGREGRAKTMQSSPDPSGGSETLAEEKLMAAAKNESLLQVEKSTDAEVSKPEMKETVEMGVTSSDDTDDDNHKNLNDIEGVVHFWTNTERPDGVKELQGVNRVLSEDGRQLAPKEVEKLLYVDKNAADQAAAPTDNESKETKAPPSNSDEKKADLSQLTDSVADQSAFDHSMEVPEDAQTVEDENREETPECQENQVLDPEQPFVPLKRCTLRPTPWLNCCGLFEYLRSSAR